MSRDVESSFGVASQRFNASNHFTVARTNIAHLEFQFNSRTCCLHVLCKRTIINNGLRTVGQLKRVAILGVLYPSVSLPVKPFKRCVDVIPTPLFTFFSQFLVASAHSREFEVKIRGVLVKFNATCFYIDLHCQRVCSAGECHGVLTLPRKSVDISSVRASHGECSSACLFFRNNSFRHGCRFFHWVISGVEETKFLILHCGQYGSVYFFTHKDSPSLVRVHDTHILAVPTCTQEIAVDAIRKESFTLSNELHRVATRLKVGCFYAERLGDCAS